ncbi:single-stranded dna-binding protein [Lasius niger]|uniref:Single-stranded DNA-binding protein n=1 Tax=Lasius niger TaxID=67767 RepID=A0A0J7KQJ3_LASNI|nr:single-stranded dna-binding protein [Lasius niger]
MAGLNKACILGNLGTDPESRMMQNGKKVVNLRIATSQSWTDRASGERKERTEWHRIVIFNERLGEIAEKYLQKGRSVYVEGELRTRSWTDQTGQEKYTTEIVLDAFRGELVLVGGNGGGEGRSSSYGGDFASAAPRQGAAPARKQESSWDVPSDNHLDDDIPF